MEEWSKYFLRLTDLDPETCGIKVFPPQGGSVGLIDPSTAAGRDSALGHPICAYPL